MSQTHITGTLKDSGGAVFGGTLKVTLDAPLLEGSAILTTKPKTFTIPNTGVIDLYLEESESSQITYYFEVKDANGDDVIPPFHAIVPNLEEANFWELYPVSALTDLLPAGLRRLAQIIATNPTYADAIRSLRPEGEYDPDVFYSKGSLVSFGGGSYLYLEDVLAKGRTPTFYNGSIPGNEIYWQTIAVKGASSGLAPENDTFNRTSWMGNYQAPTKGSLAAAIVDRNAPAALAAWNKTNVSDFGGLELLTLTDLLVHFATKQDANLTGDPQAPTKGIGDTTNSVATCNHVKLSTDALQTAVNIALQSYYTKAQADAITNPLAPRDSPTLTGTVSIASTAAFNRNDAMAANTLYVNQRLRVYASGNNTANITSGQSFTFANWLIEAIDLGNNFNPTTGQWTCPATGYYRVFAQIAVTKGTATYSGGAYRIFYNVTDSQNGLVATVDTQGDDYSAINGVLRCVQNKIYDFRFFAAFSGGTLSTFTNTAALSIEWVAS